MPAPLGVRLLGTFELDGADLGALRSRKARTLLKRLALAEGAPVPVDDLVDALWGEELPADPAGDLAVLASRARAVVGASRIVRRGDAYALLADSNDRVELTELTRQAAQRLGAADLAGARAAAETALGMIRGSLLADEPDAPWAVGPRAAVAAAEGELQRIAGEAALAAGHPVDALLHARAARERDPFDEAALRVEMRAHVAVGRPASALAAYAAARQVLAEELGVSPNEATEQLHSDVLTGGGGPEPATPPSSTPLVGRSEEMGRLDAALVRSRSAAEVVLVRGEPGIGKSSVLREWAAAARRRGVTIASCRADGYLDIGLQPLFDALATVGVEPAMTDELGSAVPAPTMGGEALALQRLQQVSTAFREVIERRGSGGVALTLDDGDRADAATRAWLRHVARRPAEHQMLVVVAWMDGEPVDVPCTLDLRLEPWGIDDVSAVVGAERAAELLARTGGNPLLVVELAGAGGDEIPATVRDAVGARLLQTGAAAGALRTAAVLGAQVDLDLLATVSEEAPTAVLAHLDEGLRRGFLAERAGVIEFRHALVREAVAAGVTPPRRAFVHRRAAQALSAHQDVDPMRVARHARLADDPALASAALTDAAALARARFDLDGSRSMLDEAIELSDGSQARLERARTRMAGNDISGADEDALAAVSMGAGAEALELRAWAARLRHDMPSAIRLGEAGAASAADARTRASCQLVVGLAHGGMGRLAEADDALAEARRNEPGASVGVGAWIGVLRVHQGRPAEALELLEPLVGSPAGPQHAFGTEHVLQMTAHAYGMLGRVSDAFAMLDRLDAELVRRGSEVRYAGMPLTYRSWLLRNLGDPSALDVAEAAAECATGEEALAQAHLDLAEARLAVHGDADGAWSELQRSLDLLRARWFQNRWRFEQRAGLLTARLHLSAGSTDAAAVAARGVEAAAAERGDGRALLRAQLLLLRVEARRGWEVDADELAHVCAHLPSVAGVEAWWSLAALADDLDSPRVREWAVAAGAALLAQAGDHADALPARAVLALRGL